MHSDFQLLAPDKKARILRAFFMLKRGNDYQELHSFLSSTEQETLRNLATAPLDQVPTLQGRAQVLRELIELMASATEGEIDRLLNP